MNTLEELLEDELKDLFNAENQLLKALPKMAKRASSQTLRGLFDAHLKETEGQIVRLEKVAKSLDISLKGKVCKAMQGLIEEAREVLEDDGDGPVIDAALIGAAQRVEHYEIAGYGVARALAQTLGHDDVVTLLQQTLNEEGEADKKLTAVAEEEIYSAAHSSADNELSEGDEDEAEVAAPAGRKSSERGTPPRSPSSRSTGRTVGTSRRK